MGGFWESGSPFSGLSLVFYSFRSSLLSRRSDVGFTAVYLHKTIESVSNCEIIKILPSYLHCKEYKKGS